MTNIKKWFLILVGTLTWSLTMVKSGWVNSYGMGFWGANGHDGIWHIALAESLSKGTFHMPIFSGESVQNYHIGFDLLLAGLHKIFLIPIPNLYFQVIPPLFALLIGFLTYQFVFEWTKSQKSAFWSVFFVYFGGSLGWVISRGESTFWSQQQISTLINPPFALSIVMILLGLFVLFKEKKVFLDFLFCTLIFGFLIEVKAYAGILILGALLVSGIYRYFKEKKKDILIIFTSSLVVSLILFITSLKNASSLFVWQPFWFLETMMGSTDRLGWIKYFSAMTNYKSGHLWFKAVPAYVIAFAIFWIGNMGTRLVKGLMLIKWLRNFKNISWVEVFLSSVIAAGGLIPMLFLQKGTPWNTIQFFYYSLFFSSILAGVASEKINSKILFVLALITIPTTFLTLKDVYVPFRPPAMLSNQELSALAFLSKLPDGVVLTYPFDSIKAQQAEAKPPRPLYLYTSTAYVSAFSKHPTFLEDEINLNITGYDWRIRRAEVEDWYKESDNIKAREFLRNNDIEYIYWLKGQRALLGETQLGIKNIYENNEVIVYQTN